MIWKEWSERLKDVLGLKGSPVAMAIAYPLVSGEVNLSFLDYTARKMKQYDPSELVVTVPSHRMPDLVASIPRCTAGTAETTIPPEFAESTRE